MTAVSSFGSGAPRLSHPFSDRRPRTVSLQAPDAIPTVSCDLIATHTRCTRFSSSSLYIFSKRPGSFCVLSLSLVVAFSHRFDCKLHRPPIPFFVVTYVPLIPRRAKTPSPPSAFEAYHFHYSCLSQQADPNIIKYSQVVRESPRQITISEEHLCVFACTSVSVCVDTLTLGQCFISSSRRFVLHHMLTTCDGGACMHFDLGISVTLSASEIV